MPLNQRVVERMLVCLCLNLWRVWLVFGSLLFSRFYSNSSIYSSMLLIDFYCFYSQARFYFFFASALYYLTNRRFFFCRLSPFCLSSLGDMTASSNSSDRSCLMFLSTAIRLILAMKLGWYTLGCLAGSPSSKSMQVGRYPFLLSFSRLLIFSISMRRSICLVVSQLSRSSEGSSNFLFQICSFSLYFGRQSLTIRCLRVSVATLCLR